MSVSFLGVLTTVVIAHFIALVSPGPDFLLVVKSAVRNRKSIALGVAFGISIGNGVYISLCILGVGAVLSTSLMLMSLLKIVGGAFLIYIAYQAIRSKRADYTFILNNEKEGFVKAKSTFFKEFFVGFITGISNPKNILFYLSLFSIVLTDNVGIWLRIGLGIWMTLLVFLWDAFIIVVLSQEKVKSVFSRIAFFIDKLAGTILGLIGMEIVASAVFEKRRI